jgi:methionine biosynthesis protein MetW
VSFPNFGHWRIRLQFLIDGRMPVTQSLPELWHETQNIHHCTIKDFLELCKTVDAKIERSVALNAYGKRMGINLPLIWHNLIGEQAVFLLTRNGERIGPKSGYRFSDKSDGQTKSSAAPSR